MLRDAQILATSVRTVGEKSIILCLPQITTLLRKLSQRFGAGAFSQESSVKGFENARLLKTNMLTI